MVKSLNAEPTPPPPPGLPPDGKVLRAGSGQGAPCRFWGSDSGCRKGEGCGFQHDWAGLNKTGRCFACSGLGHSKKDCPTKVPKGPKAAKLKNAGVEGTTSSSSSAAPQRTPPPPAAPGHAEDAPRDGSAGGWGEKQEAEKPQSASLEDPTVELMKEAAGLLKSLRSIRALQMKYHVASVGSHQGESGEEEVALLDGGATHALRQARAHEKEKLWEVEVELALGSAKLYRHDGTTALLTLEPVEPIIPLRMLIEGGFSIAWGARGCVIEHPVHGKLQCWLRHGCPVMKRREALRLLDFLDEKQLGFNSVVDHDWWRSRLPGLPSEVVEFMKRTPDIEEAGKRSPFNRRLRRRWETGKGVIIHLFSGKTGKPWRNRSWDGYDVLTLDLDEDPRQDLHDADVWGYLWKLGMSCQVRAILGGPPCRTVSRLRHQEPGPRPLRGRGEQRWCLEGLSPGELRKVHGDSALLFKQIGLWMLSEEHRPAGMPSVGFFMESPQDPAAYLEDGRAASMPSFWEFPEVKRFCAANGMNLLCFDQGTMGHPRRKPTTVATNLPCLEELDGMRGGGRDGMEVSLEKRLAQTKEWAQWAPGLVAALQRSLMIHLALCQQSMTRGEDADSRRLRAMTLDQWKEHVNRGHVPFHRRCRVCLEQAGIDRAHYRQKKGVSSYVLNVDVIGPFIEGEDVGSHRKVKYALVSTVPIPLRPRPTVPDDPGPAGAEPGEPAVLGDLVEDDAAFTGLEEPPDADPLTEDDRKKIHEKLKTEMDDMLKGYDVQNLTMVEPMESRHSSEILRALGTLYTRYRALGIPLYRLHVDRARELISASVQRWCLERDLRLTATGGDDPAANGRIEAEVCQVKRRMRIALGSAKAPLSEWPMALRHAVHQRHHEQLQKLGMESLLSLPYRSAVMVKMKRWHKGGGLETPFVPGVLLGPSPHMHVGWVVRTTDGRIQHAHTVAHPRILCLLKLWQSWRRSTAPPCRPIACKERGPCCGRNQLLQLGGSLFHLFNL